MRWKCFKLYLWKDEESRGAAKEWESPKTLRRDLRMQISPTSLVGSRLPGIAPSLSRIPACCPSPIERPYTPTPISESDDLEWVPAGAGLVPFASSLHSTKPAEVAAQCSGKVLSFGEAFFRFLQGRGPGRFL